MESRTSKAEHLKALLRSTFMRYEMRMLDNGWAVWDTELDAQATSHGRVSVDLIFLLNGLSCRCSRPASHLPPEEDLGGGDICSLEASPSTEDDKPLD
jgi:hypothetical protein